MRKLDDLCAIKVMGYRIEDGWVKELKGDHWWELCEPHEWNPSTSLDDALVCLERAANGYPWSAGRQAAGLKGGPCFCYFHGGERQDAETIAIAMCKIALRAAGVPESEISLAMEE